ncbi:MAG: Hpt domain-containing protein [Candidatus Eremiobacteraeota bacterium]|nr:Hpt domain-containing protein [Candidatus Eremiobacteraeota bacterium]
MNKLNFINKEKLSRMYGKRMNIRQVAEIYLEEMPPLVESLRDISCDEIDFERVKHRAHSLVGSFSMLCADQVAAEAKNLELAADERDMSKVRLYRLSLLGYVDALTRELKQLAREPRLAY